MKNKNNAVKETAQKISNVIKPAAKTAQDKVAAFFGKILAAIVGLIAIGAITSTFASGEDPAETLRLNWYDAVDASELSEQALVLQKKQTCMSKVHEAKMGIAYQQYSEVKLENIDAYHNIVESWDCGGK